MEAGEEGQTGRFRLWVALAVVVLLACGGSIATALATSSGGAQSTFVSAFGCGGFSTAVIPTDSSTLPPAEATMLSLDGHEYPAVVARVNGQPISGKVLAQRVYGIGHGDPAAPPVANPVKTALDGLIQDEVLLQAAQARGITVTKAEICSFERSQQEAVTQGGPQATQQIQAIAALQGYTSLAAYLASPQVMGAIRNQLLIGKLRQQIARTLLTPQPNGPSTTQQALDQFLAAQHAHVQLYIQP